MAKKRYISLTGIQYTFPVKVNKKLIWIAFKGNGNDYETSDKEVQKAIEASDRFKNKEIGLSGGQIAEVIKETPVVVPDGGPVPEEAVTEDAVTEDKDPSLDEAEYSVTSYPEVTDINGAAAVLKGEPYKVHHLSLRGKDAILAKAKELNVVFPNWVE